MSTPRVQRTVLTFLLALLLAVGSGLAPAPASAETAAPTGLRAISRSTTGLTLSWDRVSGAPQYRVAVSTSSGMTAPTYHRETSLVQEVTGLRTATTYYAQVRVISADGASLGPYSPVVRLSTLGSGGYPHLAPSGLRVGVPTSGSVRLDWAERAQAGERYRVQYSTSSSMSGASYARTTDNDLDLSGLEPSTRYWFKVRVISGDSAGTNRSDYSPAVSLATTARAASVAQPLVVGSYNVKCANCFDGLADELPWAQRRDVVAATIEGERPDVVGLQEASQGWLKTSSGASVDRSQFEDLVQALGSPYKLTNSHRNNCVKSTTPTGCVYADRGASQGTRLVYDSSRVSLQAAGSRLLASKEGSNARYAAWGRLTQLSTGRKFLVVNTHLEPRDASSSKANWDLRRRQASELVTLIQDQRKGLPVIVTGDFNSHKWTPYGNAPRDLLTGAGLVDPLGNGYETTWTAPGATVEKRVRSDLSSYNGFQRTAPGFDYINGTYLDYVMTTPMRVSEWETVARLDSSGRFVGTIPSDHNMVRATVWLPR